MLDVLTQLYLDTGSESCFSGTEYQAPSVLATAQGLRLVKIYGLEGQFPVSELVSYLSARQDPDGGFGAHITTTFHVTEALYEAGAIGSIDRTALVNWLRACVISSGDAPPESGLWGAVARNPDVQDATNSYATDFLLTLRSLGESHNDPVKLTQWIEKTVVGDGSYYETLSPSSGTVTGTSSALTSLEILGQLDPMNRTSGLSWLSTVLEYGFDLT